MGIIKAKDLVHEYIRRDEEGNVESIQTALDKVSLDVKKGDFIAVLGHNGSGKSTLAKHINAILEPSEGSLWVDVKTDRYLQGARQPIFDEAPIVTGDREIGRFRVQGVNLGQAESIFDSPPVSELQRSLRVLNLSERRSLGAHPLIRRRILVDRPVSKPQTHPEAGEEK